MPPSPLPGVGRGRPSRCCRDGPEGRGTGGPGALRAIWEGWTEQDPAPPPAAAVQEEPTLSGGAQARSEEPEVEAGGQPAIWL